MLYCKLKLPDEVCISHAKRIGENTTVLQLKQFEEVLLTSLTFEKMSSLDFVYRKRISVKVCFPVNSHI